MSKPAYELTFPCYCCGKEVKMSKSHFIVTKDGADWMSHDQFKAYCAERNVDHADPFSDDLKSHMGCGWRPEIYGPSCFARERKAHKTSSVIIKGSDGRKYLFIDSNPAA